MNPDIPISSIIALVWIHFIADFVLQSDKMALNKSTSFKWLSVHSLVYALPFIVFNWKMLIFAGISHMIIDSISSKGTTALYIRQQRHWFFVVIGLDQACHMTTLLLFLAFFA